MLHARLPPVVLGSVLGGHSGHTMWGASAGLTGILCDIMVFCDNDNGNSRSFIVIVPLDKPAPWAGGSTRNRPTAHVVRAMKDEYLGTHPYHEC